MLQTFIPLILFSRPWFVALEIMVTVTAQEESLRNQLQVLKDRMKEMEELFSAQDEESRQLIQELKNEQKDSANKVTFDFVINQKFLMKLF